MSTHAISGKAAASASVLYIGQAFGAVTCAGDGTFSITGCTTASTFSRFIWWVTVSRLR